jgi:hypothetical protein
VGTLRFKFTISRFLRFLEPDRFPILCNFLACSLLQWFFGFVIGLTPVTSQIVAVFLWCMWQFHTHQSYTTTEKYLDLLSQALEKAAQNFEPDLLIYNAGTDILDGDPLGRLLVSPDGVKQRDEMVFKFSREKNCPIVMLTSGTFPFQQCYSRFIAGR